MLRRELRRLGFSELDTTGRLGDTWVNPGDEDGIAVIVPREEDRDDGGFLDLVASAVDRLGWITETSSEHVLRMLAGHEDRLELRILHTITADHGVPALKAPNVMDGFVRLIKNGARTRFNGARADHRGPTGGDYTEALNSIRILAPAPGSFRLIAVASEPEQTSVTQEHAEAKARETLITTMKSLQTLSTESRPVEDLEDDDVERLVDGGVSRQLLNAVKALTITPTSGLQLEFTASWDESIGAPDIDVSPVVIGDAQIALAKTLYERLAKYEPDPDYFLSGWAELAKADERSLEGFPAGTIVVRTKHEGRNRDVLVELGAETFHTIKPGVSDVQMRGKLERIGGRWHLVEPRDVLVATPAAASPKPKDQMTTDEDGV
jgi:hypothetical protein